MHPRTMGGKRRKSLDGRMNSVSEDLKGLALGNYMHNVEETRLPQTFSPL
jgi:hypothetical protein